MLCEQLVITFPLCFSPASVGDQESCDRDGTTRLEEKSGYISSVALRSNFFGTTACPFTVTVQPGQTIEFTLYDFTLKDVGGSSTGGTGPPCPYEVVFTENRAPNPRNLCNGSFRQRFLYSSRTSSVQVHFVRQTNTNTDVPLFFVSYVGKIIIHMYFACSELDLSLRRILSSLLF